MKQEKLFDVSKWEDELGSRFPKFQELAVQLWRLLARQGKAAIEVGRIANEMMVEYGKSIWEAFLFEMDIPYTYVQKCLGLYAKFGHLDIPESVSMKALEIVARVPKGTEEWDTCLKMISEEVDWKRIKEYLDSRRKTFVGGSFLPRNEQDVVTEVRKILAKEGWEEISGECILPNGLRVDLVAKRDDITLVCECKYKLELKTLQQAQGQTEQYAWEFSRPLRMIAAAIIDDDARDIAALACKKGIRVVKVDIKK